MATTWSDDLISEKPTVTKHHWPCVYAILNLLFLLLDRLFYQDERTLFALIFFFTHHLLWKRWTHTLLKGISTKKKLTTSPRMLNSIHRASFFRFYHYIIFNHEQFNLTLRKLVPAPVRKIFISVSYCRFTRILFGSSSFHLHDSIDANNNDKTLNSACSLPTRFADHGDVFL